MSKRKVILGIFIITLINFINSKPHFLFKSIDISHKCKNKNHEVILKILGDLINFNIFKDKLSNWNYKIENFTELQCKMDLSVDNNIFSGLTQNGMMIKNTTILCKSSFENNNKIKNNKDNNDLYLEEPLGIYNGFDFIDPKNDISTWPKSFKNKKNDLYECNNILIIKASKIKQQEIKNFNETSQITFIIESILNKVPKSEISFNFIFNNEINEIGNCTLPYNNNLIQCSHITSKSISFFSKIVNMTIINSEKFNLENDIEIKFINFENLNFDFINPEKEQKEQRDYNFILNHLIINKEYSEDNSIIITFPLIQKNENEKSDINVENYPSINANFLGKGKNYEGICSLMKNIIYFLKCEIKNGKKNDLIKISKNYEFNFISQSNESKLKNVLIKYKNDTDDLIIQQELKELTNNSIENQSEDIKNKDSNLNENIVNIKISNFECIENKNLTFNIQLNDSNVINNNKLKDFNFGINNDFYSKCIIIEQNNNFKCIINKYNNKEKLLQINEKNLKLIEDEITKCFNQENSKPYLPSQKSSKEEQPKNETNKDEGDNKILNITSEPTKIFKEKELPIFKYLRVSEGKCLDDGYDFKIYGTIINDKKFNIIDLQGLSISKLPLEINDKIENVDCYMELNTDFKVEYEITHVLNCKLRVDENKLNNVFHKYNIYINDKPKEENIFGFKIKNWNNELKEPILINKNVICTSNKINPTNVIGNKTSDVENKENIKFYVIYKIESSLKNGILKNDYINFEFSLNDNKIEDAELKCKFDNANLTLLSAMECDLTDFIKKKETSSIKLKLINLNKKFLETDNDEFIKFEDFEKLDSIEFKSDKIKEIENCIKFDKESNQCIRCSKKFYLNKEKTKCETCEERNHGCFMCDYFGRCMICKTQFKLSINKKCVPKLNCPQDTYGPKCEPCEKLNKNCIQCNLQGICEKCKKGTFYYSTNSGPKCITCSPGCQMCTALDECTSCQNGFYLEDGKCLSCFNSVLGCQQCSSKDTCDKCYDKGIFNEYKVIGNSCKSNKFEERENTEFKIQKEKTILKYEGIDSFIQIDKNLQFKIHFLLINNVIYKSNLKFAINLFFVNDNDEINSEKEKKTSINCYQYDIALGFTNNNYLVNYLCELKSEKEVSSFKIDFDSMAISSEFNLNNNLIINKDRIISETINVNSISDDPLDEVFKKSNILKMNILEINKNKLKCKTTNTLEFTINSSFDDSYDFGNLYFKITLYNNDKIIYADCNIQNIANKENTEIVCVTSNLESDIVYYIKDGIYDSHFSNVYKLLVSNTKLLFLTTQLKCEDQNKNEKTENLKEKKENLKEQIPNSKEKKIKNQKYKRNRKFTESIKSFIKKMLFVIFIAIFIFLFIRILKCCCCKEEESPKINSFSSYSSSQNSYDSGEISRLVKRY